MAVGDGSASRARVAAWRWLTAAELVPGEAKAWWRISRTLDQLAGPEEAGSHLAETKEGMEDWVVGSVGLGGRKRALGEIGAGDVDDE